MARLVNTGDCTLTLGTLQKSSYPLPTLDQASIRTYEHIHKNAAKDANDSDLELVLDARPGGR